MTRSAGVLLHPTSLPSPFGVGDFLSAIPFVDAIADAGATWWQVLPLGPPDSYGSPYASISAFALNPTLIDPSMLRAEVSEEIWESFEDNVSLFDDDFFDVGSVTAAKSNLLRHAYERFDGSDEFDAYCDREREWLDDFSTFAAIRDARNEPWWCWPDDLKRRDETALQDVRSELGDDIRREQYVQWIADRQWARLRAHASERNVKILGDIPIFVSMDSADVWANQHFFLVNERGEPEFVAGVPPDYFSPTGQKWGNPLYNWEALADDGYRWWRARIERVLALSDSARIDHFRGFSEYWAVPYDAPTAETGEWRPGPRHAFFEFVKETFGDVPFVAEDLGLITQDVIDLREAFDLPGMRVMQFAFDDDNRDHPFRPHQYPERCVAYLGTHDNDTTQGWLDGTYESTKNRLRSYFECSDDEILDAMLAALFESRAELVVVTSQDLLGLGSDARMNAPGSADGNWGWRITDEQLNDPAAWETLRRLIEETDR